MLVKINGENHKINIGATIASILQEFQIDQNRVAIEKNLEIIPCSQFDSTSLVDGDQIEVVEFIGGG